MTEFIGGPSLASNPEGALRAWRGYSAPHQQEPETAAEAVNPNETAAENWANFQAKWSTYESEAAAIVARFTSDAGGEAVAHAVEEPRVELEADPAYL